VSTRLQIGVLAATLVRDTAITPQEPAVDASARNDQKEPAVDASASARIHNGDKGS
jgi:hypothetical protein